MRRSSRIALTLLLAAVPASAQTAKAARPLPVMRGAVQDTSGKPLEGAQIEILGLDRTVTTPAGGAYRIDEIKPGKYWVAVRRIGFAPLHTALNFNPGDDRRIVFQLEPLPQYLPDVEVRAEDARWARRYQDFLWRSHSAFGHFLTRDDIERAHPSYLSDVVRRYLPFTTTESFFTAYFPDPSGLMNRVASLGPSDASRRAAEAGRCAPSVSVNGSRPWGGWAVNDFRPEDVEAIEVYRNIRQLPAEFVGWGVGCGGLVVVWLH
jgi:protocatechuate 3,4-dioxygenase beta subunit